MVGAFAASSQPPNLSFLATLVAADYCPIPGPKSDFSWIQVEKILDPGEVVGSKISGLDPKSFLLDPYVTQT